MPEQPSAKVGFAFSAKDEGARLEAQRHAAQLVTNVSEETRKALRALIAKSIREGIPPLEAAKSIRSLVGMNASQAAAAMNYRAELKTQGLSEERVDKALEFYAARKVKERGDTIARTEVLSALNAGSLASWKQAQRKGFLPRNAKKKFITTPDEKLCKTCRPMNKQEQPLQKPFIMPNGGKLMFPPAHPRCRCTMGEPSALGGGPPRRLDAASILEAGRAWLTHGMIIDRQLIGGSATKVYDISLMTPSGLRHTIFKPPDSGDLTLRLINSGNLSIIGSTAERELLSAAFGRVLGIPEMPDTVGRLVRLGSKQFFGSMSERILDTASLKQVLGGWFRIIQPDPAGPIITNPPLLHLSDHTRNGLTVLDLLIGNMDRHPGNMLVRFPGHDAMMQARAVSNNIGNAATWSTALRNLIQDPLKFIAIDHGYTFGRPRPGHEGEVLGLPNRMMAKNSLGPFWRQNMTDRSSALKSLSADARDFWVDKLVTSQDTLKELLTSASLSLDEKEGAMKRLQAVLNALYANTLGGLLHSLGA